MPHILRVREELHVLPQPAVLVAEPLSERRVGEHKAGKRAGHVAGFDDGATRPPGEIAERAMEPHRDLGHPGILRGAKAADLRRAQRGVAGCAEKDETADEKRRPGPDERACDTEDQ